MRLISMLVRSVLLIVPLISAVSAADSILGASLETATKTDFFTFFHLKQCASETDDQKKTTVAFKPTAEKFSKLVTVKLVLDAQQNVSGMQLDLARSFIDDKMNGIFAADIADSMLRTILPEADAAKMKDLMVEIQHGSVGDQIVLKADTAKPTLPNPPTPGYQTYAGKRDNFTQDLEKTTVELRKAKVEKDGDTLSMIVRAK